MTDAQKAWQVECALAGYEHLVRKAKKRRTLCGFGIVSETWDLVGYLPADRVISIQGTFSLSGRCLCPRCVAHALKNFAPESLVDPLLELWEPR